jgi:hypothetical protein
MGAVPTAIAAFLHDLAVPPREYAERTYNVVRYTRFERGGTSRHTRSQSCWFATSMNSSTAFQTQLVSSAADCPSVTGRDVEVLEQGRDCVP